MFSKNMSKKNFLIILFLSINISFLSSCKKDESSDPDVAPKRDLETQSFLQLH